MSLINDALKKAQKQRTGDAPSLGSMPSVGGQSAASISRSGKSSGNPLLIPAGIGATVLVLAIGGYFAFRGKPETGNLKPEVSKATTAQAQSSTPNVGSPLVGGPSSAPSSPFPAPNSAQPPTTAPAFTLQVAPKTELPKTTAQTQSSSPAAQRLDEPAVALAKAGPSEASAPPKPALKLEPRAMTFIDNIKIAGVRASGTDSKVLMMDRVYRVGDMVDHEMGLKLVGITSNSLTFEDEKGGRYTRNL